MLNRDQYVCRVGGPTCKVTATTVDHIIPVSRGGAVLDHRNLRAACSSCQTWLTHETRRMMADTENGCLAHQCTISECGGPHTEDWCGGFYNRRTNAWQRSAS